MTPRNPRGRMNLSIIAAIVAASATAYAQKASGELEVQRGPASELYIRKRPPAPEAPVLSTELKELLSSTEKKRDDKRLQAIGMLREFLGGRPQGDTKAEGMFKLAELLWEESRRLYLIRMDDFSRDLEKCTQKKGNCEQPKEPHIDLKEAEVLYRDLHESFPTFRRMDLVTYLIGFAAKEDLREDEAMGRFQEVIDRFPQSPLFGDAWMMIGEHYFANAQWEKAKEAYTHIDYNAPTADLALFKTAWCEWKLGQTEAAAKDFKKVLDKALEAERHGTLAQQQRSVNLRDQALEYLVVVFTEDRSISAKEVFDFLGSIGGEQYSGDILIRVAASYASQTEWDRSNEAYRFLVKMDPESIKAAEYQREIVQNWNSGQDPEKAQDEIKVLLETYGPNTAWAKSQKNRDALARSLETTEELVRVTATSIHGEAQRREKQLRLAKTEGCVTKPTIPADLVGLYGRAADAYEQYLEAFGTGKTATAGSTEIRYYRADILCFKLGKVEQAGDEYLAVGKSAPVGQFHKQALTNAMAAFEAARPQNTQGRHQLFEVDKKFGEAIDLFATLFPADAAIVGVIFKNGQMFYDYGEFDEAIKRFGVIVTKYPKDPNAGPAGDRILAALNKAQDYENIESWARKLRTAPSFAGKDQQERLNRLIVESILKSGDHESDLGLKAEADASKAAQAHAHYERAATFYLRVPKETTDPKVGAQAMMNAGVMYEKAKRPEDAADIYLDLAEKYDTKSPDLAEKAAFAAGQVYEKVIYYDRAAKAYELVVDKFGKGQKAPDALFNAGLLRQALGQNDKAIVHYREYAKRFAERKDAPDVAFNIGVVYEDAGQDGPAYQAFADYARVYKSAGKRLVESYTRAGRTTFRLAQRETGKTKQKDLYKRASGDFDQAEALYKKLPHDSGKPDLNKPWAAEARYYKGELIFREYEAVTLDVKPRELTNALTTKKKLLDKANKVYLSVVDYQDLKWATAALFRVGQVYDGFSEALAAAANKPPSTLKPDEVAAYQDKLNEYVVNIADIAVQAFSAGYNKAIQMQVYDEYTAKIRAALGRLAAGQFPPERESRSKERSGDRPPNPELATEVAR
ncbi:MAG: Tetratricopeptide 2 repeat protein [Myxococcales bacterium]|nr:Tetratricopeptide 2 repeat protein [Myxococcales bacterium]